VLIEAKDDDSVGDNWSYKSYKAPVKSTPPTNQHPTFYRPDALPFAKPTVSKHWRKNITFHGLAYPSSPGVFQLCLWPLIAPGYFGEVLPCLSSALWSQYRYNNNNYYYYFYYYLHQGGWDFIDIACLFVWSRIMQKLLHGFSQNLVERWHVGQRRNVKILVVIQIWIWIKDFFEGTLLLQFMVYWQRQRLLIMGSTTVQRYAD